MKDRSLFQCYVDNLKYPVILRNAKQRMRELKSSKNIKKNMNSFFDQSEKYIKRGLEKAIQPVFQIFGIDFVVKEDQFDLGLKKEPKKEIEQQESDSDSSIECYDYGAPQVKKEKTLKTEIKTKEESKNSQEEAEDAREMLYKAELAHKLF